MSNYIKKIINYFLNASFTIKLPPKSEIIIYDRNRSDIIYSCLNEKKKIDILDVRGEKFYILILLFNLLNLKFSLREYIESYINFSKPKFVITLRDNDIGFFKLTLKKTKKILVQQSWKNEYDDEFLKNLEQKKNFKYKIDYIFCFNENIKKKYSEIIDGNFFLSGSLKSNSFLRESFVSKERDISFISGGDGNTLKLTHPKLIGITEKILRHLSNFCEENKRLLYVYGKSTFPEDEEIFYDEILGRDNYTFIPNHIINPIRLVDSSNIIINFNSTLGYESFSRGNKTIFLNFRHHIHHKSLKFGWPKEFLDEGPFWTSKIDYTSVSKLIHEVSKMSESQWKLIVDKYSTDLMVTDFDNSKLKKIINC